MYTREYPEASKEHWSRVAPLFSAIKPPLKPREEDLDYVRDIVRNQINGSESLRVAILGVTREYYDLPWPEGTDLIAIDRSQAMIDHVWPGPPETVRRCDWRDLCLSDKARNFAITDGGLSMLPYPLDLEAVVNHLARILEPGGIFLARLYAPHKDREPIDQIIDDLKDGKIANMSEFKIRMWMTVQETPEKGMAVHDVWNEFTARVPDLSGLCTALGWSESEAATLERYRESNDRYYHPTKNDVVRVFTSNPGTFEFLSAIEPSYSVGRFCPTVVFRRV